MSHFQHASSLFMVNKIIFFLNSVYFRSSLDCLAAFSFAVFKNFNLICFEMYLFYLLIIHFAHYWTINFHVLIYYYSLINFFDFGCFYCLHYYLNGAYCSLGIDLLFCQEISLVAMFEMYFLGFALYFHFLIFNSYNPHFIMLLDCCFLHSHFFISSLNKQSNFENYLQFLQIEIEVDSKFNLWSDWLIAKAIHFCFSVMLCY